MSSEIAQILYAITQEYEASKRGLEGLSYGTTRHDFIQQKTAAIGQYHTHLEELVGPERAITMIANTIWTPAEQREVPN